MEPNLGAAALRSLAALPGGGVLAAGTTYGSNSRGVVLRLSPSGARDHAFGADGLATLRFGYKHRCAAEAIAVQGDGKVLVAGYIVAKGRGAKERLAVTRLLPNGAVDRSFGHRGLVSRRVGSQSRATAIAVQRNGKILVAGRSRRRAGIQELLLRLTAAGRFAQGFGRNGISSSKAPVDPKRPGSANGAEPKQILPRPHGYVVARNGPGLPLLAYRHDGKVEPRSARGAVAADGREFGPPAATLQRGKLVLVRGVDKFTAFQVQRLLLH